jgi:hypothetical protein
MAALPGCNIPPNGFTGPDAPPCVPTIFDDEMQQTFGAPGDVNDPFWTWLLQHSATATWTSGTINLTSDTNANHDLESLYEALPGATPYTFEIWFSLATLNGGDSNCGIGLQESSTGKVTGFSLVDAQNQNTLTNQAGMFFRVCNYPNVTSYGTVANVWYQAYQGLNSAYLRIQNDGTNLKYSYSPTVDGVNFTQVASQLVTAAFTTAPNRVFILVTGNSTAPTTCTFDFIRRTQ